MNDELTVHTGLGIESIDVFKIFNRSGALVYQTNQQVDWDGTFNGQLAATGTYLWVMEFLKSSGENELKTGTVNLLR